MKMTPVESDWIEAIGHDAAKHVLHVRLKTGDTYTYFDVSAEKHAALMVAESHGKHLNLHIKGAHHAEKVPARKKRAA